MRAILLACAITLAAGPALSDAAQTAATVPKADDLPQTGELDGAYVIDVVIMIKSNIGPFTRFLIKPSQDSQRSYWFYVRNDDNTKALERGAIIGLLMGAVEANRLSGYGTRRGSMTVNFTYSTVAGRQEIVTASLASKLEH
jgi:hypothetical protein